MTVPCTPGGTRKEVSRTSAAFSPKIARRSFSSGVNWVSAFGVSLPTGNIARFQAPMRTTPASSKSFKDSSLTIWNIRCDFLFAKFGITANAFKLLNIDRSIEVFTYNTFRNDNTVFVIINPFKGGMTTTFWPKLTRPFLLRNRQQ